MSESANQDGEAPADVSAPSDEPMSTLPSISSTHPDAGSSPGLLAELLEGAREQPRDQAGAQARAQAGTQAGARDQAGAQARTATPASHPSAFGTRVGWLVEWASGSAPTVDFPGNELGPLAARSVIPLDPNLVAEAIAEQRGVMLSFEDGRPHAPIITGLLQPVVFETEIEIEAQIPTEADQDLAEADHEQATGGIPAMQASVDGRRVEIEAEDEIVLRCGQASIVLRRNGRVVIRGTYVETRSRGVNRIKGGSVQIN